MEVAFSFSLALFLGLEGAVRVRAEALEDRACKGTGLIKMPGLIKN